MIDYLIALGLFAGGWLLGLFGWAQVIITNRFGVPYTLDLLRQGMIEMMYARYIVKSHKTAAFIWTVLILSVSAVVVIFVHLTLGLIGFFVGLLVSFISIWRKSGPTDSNIEEFVQRNNRFINTGNGIDESITEKISLLKGAEALRKFHLLTNGQKWPGRYDI